SIRTTPVPPPLPMRGLLSRVIRGDTQDAYLWAAYRNFFQGDQSRLDADRLKQIRKTTAGPRQSAASLPVQPKKWNLRSEAYVRSRTTELEHSSNRTSPCPPGRASLS